MNIGRDEMLNERGNVNSLIFRYMTSEGNLVKKSWHSSNSSTSENINQRFYSVLAKSPIEL